MQMATLTDEPSLRIAYHADTFAKRARFGLSRYAHSLRDALDDQGVTAIPFSSQSDFAVAPPWLAQRGFCRLPIRRKLLAPAWTYTGLPRAEWMLPPFDLLHSIDVDYRAPTGKPWVVTIHDLGVLVHPEYFSGAVPWLLRAYLKQIAARADRVLCVSHSTAAEVTRFTGMQPGERLRVIEEGVDEAFFDPPAATALAQADGIIAPDTPFLLFSGSTNPRKNLHRVLNAYRKLVPGIGLHLVIVGAWGSGDGELAADIDAARATGMVHTPGYVSDEVLQALLFRADAFLYPSLYEGFGLPILEAMASGTPVITSTNSSMPEIAADAAILVDASDEAAIGEAMMRVAQDRPAMAALREKGVAHARRFSWADTARRTINVYRELV